MHSRDGITLPSYPPYSADISVITDKLREAGHDPPEALFIEDCETQQVISDWIGRTVANGDQYPYFFFGYVKYSDSMNMLRTMALCRRYNPSTRRFMRIDDSEYEYAD